MKTMTITNIDNEILTARIIFFTLPPNLFCLYYVMKRLLGMEEDVQKIFVISLSMGGIQYPDWGGDGST